MFGFFKKPFESISVEEAAQKKEIIDIREPSEYRMGHLPNAKNIPMGTILQNPGNFLKPTEEYFIICQSGGRSSNACGELTAKGYKVVNVSGGTMSYRGALKRA